jgi:catechol 2,3-dioxygenase-like lactoylglutathione lyase family enzyme
VTYHLGRLIDHVHIVVADLGAAYRFYAAAFGALGQPAPERGPGFFYFDELFVSGPKYGSTAPSHIHLAFQAPDRDTVDRFHAAALAAGGRDNGKPGERPYHPGYYAAFVLDPDGNNIEAVFHGPGKRSAPSVTIEPAA